MRLMLLFAIVISFSPLQLVAAPPTNDADYNNDGIVNGIDFLHWQRGYGKFNATHFDGNGQVNSADLEIWKAHFGQSEMAPVVVNVPEPGALTLAVGAVGYLAVLRRRRRKTCRRGVRRVRRLAS